MKHVCVGLAAVSLLLGACGSDGGGGPPTGNSQTGTIVGQVIDADSGNAGVPGVSVQLTGSTGTRTVTSGTGGAFSATNAAAGTWDVSLQLPSSYRLAANEVATRSATVTANQTTTLTPFRMARPKGQLSGSATAQGAAVGGGTVTASRGGFTARTATPGVAGFTISDLPVGSWSVSYTPPATHVLAQGEPGTRTAAITEGQTTTTTAFLLQPAPQGAVVEIRLNGTSFTPSTVTIAAGTTVRWINEDGASHTVTPENASQPGVWARQTTSTAGVVFQHTFTVSNQTYRFRCEPHSSSFTSGMVGVITVT